MDDVYDRIRKRIKPETRDKIKNMMKNIQAETIIKEAFNLYMPQVKSEITDLTNFLLENTDWKRDRPINILEIGTKFGGTFYIWNEINRQMYERSQDWDLNGESDGKVCISIDMSDGGIHGGISDEEMDTRDLWFLERFDNCHFIRGDSHIHETANKAFSLIEPDSKIPVWFDFIFIDGDHSYEGVKKDFEMYSPFLKTNGIIAFHDTIISEEHHKRNVYVGEFWKELTSNVSEFQTIDDGICSYNGQLYAFTSFVGDINQTWAGIGVLIKL